MEQAPGELLLHDKARLASRLTKAVKNKEIQVHYQPILCSKTLAIVAAEALARWKDPKLGWISCNAFIPMAEESGLINELGHQVATQSLQQLKRWRSEGLDLTLSLNSSLRQTSMPSFGTELLKMVNEAGVDPEHVTVEVTERELIMEATGIDRFVEHGFRLAIDDFGSGYSSLSQLLDVSVHEIKIDRALTAKIQTEKGRRIMETVIRLGNILDMSLVVEGLEDEEGCRIVREMGVQKLQGYYFSQPLPADDLMEMVKNGKLTDSAAALKESV
ncbi:MAG: EAL domain-containing protein [Opitutales bacterium]